MKITPVLCIVYFKCSIRKHPLTGNITGYYRLVESYRNTENRVCHHTILNVGFMEDTTVEQRNKIQKHLTDKYEQQQLLFEETDAIVKKYVDELWQRILDTKRLDIACVEKRARLIDADTIQHSNVREIGAESICQHTWNKLQLTPLLLSNGWTEQQVQLASTQVISRAVYPASELKTARWIKENSAVCELTGYDMEKITKDKLYQSSLNLYGLKDEIEKHLSKRTNELFDMEDKIILYDLTNTYFEGQKRKSKLAKSRWLSGEKRSDARLVVLALVVNLYFTRDKKVNKIFLSGQRSTGHHPCIALLYRIPLGIFNCVLNYARAFSFKLYNKNFHDFIPCAV